MSALVPTPAISIPSILSILSRVLAPGNSLREPRAHSTVTSMSSGVQSPVSERPSHHRWLRGRSLLGTASTVAVPVLFGLDFEGEVDVSYKI